MAPPDCAGTQRNATVAAVVGYYSQKAPVRAFARVQVSFSVQGGPPYANGKWCASRLPTCHAGRMHCHW